MRLTGGQDRGRRLIAPRGARTRPTASRVREALSQGTDVFCFLKHEEEGLGPKLALRLAEIVRDAGHTESPEDESRKA